MTKTTALMCQRPDRDAPKLTCGYPLPCPWHTVTIDVTTSPPTIRLPEGLPSALAAERLGEITAAVRLPCKSRYVSKRGRTVNIVGCVHRAGHEGLHKGFRKQWDDAGRLWKRSDGAR